MKKLISILLTLALLISAVSVGAATLDNGSGDLSAEETGLMTRLEILSSDDMFSYGKNFEIPRAAFIRIADRIVKAQSADGAELPFWDVNSGNEYYSDIAAAYSFGLIDGGVGDSFRPYDIITYNEAIKIVSVMLGYKAFAAVNGCGRRTKADLQAGGKTAVRLAYRGNAGAVGVRRHGFIYHGQEQHYFKTVLRY